MAGTETRHYDVRDTHLPVCIPATTLPLSQISIDQPAAAGEVVRLDIALGDLGEALQWVVGAEATCASEDIVKRHVEVRPAVPALLITSRALPRRAPPARDRVADGKADYAIPPTASLAGRIKPRRGDNTIPAGDVEVAVSDCEVTSRARQCDKRRGYQEEPSSDGQLGTSDHLTPLRSQARHARGRNPRDQSPCASDVASPPHTRTCRTAPPPCGSSRSSS
jgi:hypothetical protein